MLGSYRNPLINYFKQNSRSMGQIPTRSNVYTLVPMFGVFVGLSALSFQIFILYPWHYEISKQFEALEVI